MPEFKRIKIQATVETESMLLRADQIDGALGQLRDRLEQLDLSIVSVEPTEPAAAQPLEPSAEDPWSFRGQAVE